MAVLLTGQPDKFAQTKFAMAGITYPELLDPGTCIQLLPNSQTEWDHPGQYSKPVLLRNIQREGILL